MPWPNGIPRPFSRRRRGTARLFWEIVEDLGFEAASVLWRRYGGNVAYLIQHASVIGIARAANRYVAHHADVRPMPPTPPREIKRQKTETGRIGTSSEKMPPIHRGRSRSSHMSVSEHGSDHTEAIKGEIKRFKYSIQCAPHGVHKKIAVFNMAKFGNTLPLNSGEGLQGVTLFPVFTKTQMVAYAPHTTKDLAYDFNMFQLSTNQATTGSVLNTALVEPYSDAVHVWSLRRQMEIANLSSLATTVEIIFIHCHKSITVDPQTHWSNCLSDLGNTSVISSAGTPLPIYAASSNQTLTGTPATGGYANYNQLGERPYGMEEWKKYFSVKKTLKIDMAAGSNVNIEAAFKYHGKIAHREDIYRDQEHVSGWTNYVMIIWKGALGVEGTNSNNVSVAPARLGVVWNDTVIVSPYQAKASNKTKWSIQRIDTGATISNMYAIQQDSNQAVSAS